MRDVGITPEELREVMGMEVYGVAAEWGPCAYCGTRCELDTVHPLTVICPECGIKSRP